MRPSILDAVPDHVVTDAKEVGPLFHRHGFPVVRDRNVVAFVIGLFYYGCPSTIGWLVVTVGVLAFDTVRLAWAWSHVGEEVHEPISTRPSFAYNYAATAIIIPIFLVAVATASVHCCPYSVFASFCFLAALTVGCQFLAKKFDLQAPATFGSSTPPCPTGEYVSAFGDVIAAVAQAKPLSGLVDGFILVDDDQFSEAFSGKINILTWHDNPPRKGCCVSRSDVHHLAA